MRIGMVCGYGIVADERLQKYLEAVIDYASAHQIETLILSGGYTVKDAQETEARVMWRLVQPRVSKFTIIFEEASVSTLHNLLYTKQLIKQRNLSLKTLYIFCDDVRFLKVFCLSKILFKRYDVHIVKFERKESFVMYIMQIPFTLLQCLGAIFPVVEKGILLGRQILRKKAR